MLLLARPRRQLATASSSGTSASYTYDISGVRNGKTVNGTVYRYNTLSGHVMRQEWDGKSIDFIYDDANQPYAMRYRSSAYAAPETYYYILNVQGDVVGLMDSNGVKVVSYSYDPWGKPLDTTISTDGSSSECLAWETAAEVNPLRYRGYYYDTETGFYYLQTRYFDPAIGRFINADTFATTDITGLLSSNMFAYCENNPVMGVDYNGEFLNVIIGAAVGGIISAATTAFSSYKETGHVDVCQTLISGITGAVCGGVAATGMRVFLQAGISALASGPVHLYLIASQQKKKEQS